ncbi:MAG: tetratricopeptide repeat protein [Longimicrobiales bacterium]
MKVEALKEKARRHEQKEEWQKALGLYQDVLRKHDEDEPPDITLYNRVGDIQIRVGQIDGAVESYETAIDLYMEAELPNNAIAICKKVLRNLPGRSVFFLRMGQIRASQGFLTDARQNFLTYAEQKTAAGDMDAALDALVEFVSLAPEDLEIRMGLASQLESHDRIDEAVEQYSDAYRRFVLQGQEDEAEAMAAKVRELSPEAVLPDVESILEGAEAGKDEEPFTLGSSLAGIELDAPLEEIRAGAPEREAEEEPAPPLGEGALDEEYDAGEEREEEVEPLPILSFDDEEEAEALPAFGFQEEERESGEREAEEVDPLPTLEFEEEGPPDAVSPTEEEALPAAEGMEEVEPRAVEEEEYEEARESVPELDLGLEGLPLEEAAEKAPEEMEEALLEEGPEAAPEEQAVEGAPPLLASPAEEALIAPEAFPEEALEAAVEDAALEKARAPVPSTHQEAAEQGDLDLAMEMVRAQIAGRPDEVELYQRLVEYAFRKGDEEILIQAYLELAGCLTRTDAPVKAKAIYQQVLSLAPDNQDARTALDRMDEVSTPRAPTQVASSEEYVDLGSMILGEETEKTTRWQVAADAPSGDEQADFAKMLSQFKDKVSEHVDADDVTAHHDLGTAYMEMGLFEEAISEFQMALRASPGHLPTHEVMGRCWMEDGRPAMAVRALRRALDVDFEVEDELIGIYYLMGRAQEDLGNTEEAVEFFEKVFSLDINFEDVTERLRALR